VLINVGPFKKDDAGLNWFDMDLEVTDPEGKVILSQTSMLVMPGILPWRIIMLNRLMVLAPIQKNCHQENINLLW